LWSTIRLDRDPLGRDPRFAYPCPNVSQPCVSWDLSDVDTRGYTTALAKLLILSALPAFPATTLVTFAVGRLGVSEVLSFMFFMPLLAVVWYYLVGWLVDRRGFKRSRQV
jgi:hypothetical protein